MFQPFKKVIFCVCILKFYLCLSRTLHGVTYSLIFANDSGLTLALLIKVG